MYSGYREIESNGQRFILPLLAGVALTFPLWHRPCRPYPYGYYPSPYYPTQYYNNNYSNNYYYGRLPYAPYYRYY